MDPNITKIVLKKNLILKNIDPYEVVRKIFDGTLMICTKKIKIDVTEIIADINIGPNCEYEVYEHTNNNNKKIRTFTINQKAYQAMKDSMKNEGSYNEKYLRGLNFSCDWCHQHFNCIPWQIPIKLLMNEYDKDCYTFYGDGVYCTKECMYADYKNNYDNKLNYKDGLYIETYSLIKLLCNLKNEEFPIAAPHWKLLQANGGPLPDLDFYGNKNIYNPVPNIVMLPCKRQFSINK
jgi:hypothetical protein